MIKNIIASILIWYSLSAATHSYGYTTGFVVMPQDVHKGYISEKIWLQNEAIPDITISGITYETGVSLPKDATLSDPHQLITILGVERKKPFVIVRIPAFVAGDNNSVNELKTFTLDITEKMPAATSRNSKRITDVKTSALSTGTWYKIGITKTGFCKIDYNFIKNLGVDPTSINPANIRVFGYGGHMLSEDNSVSRPSDLTENAIWVNSSSSTSFGANDYLVFYGIGTVNWFKDSVNQRFIHQNNLYTDTAYYFISFDNGPGLRISSQSSAPAANVTASGFNYYDSHELDKVSPTNGFGKLWYGEEFNPVANNLTQSFNFSTGNTITGNVFCTVSMASTSGIAGSQVSYYINSVFGASSTYQYATVADNLMDTMNLSASVVNNANPLIVTVTFTPANASSLAYLYYIEVNGREPLYMPGDQMSFRDWQTVGTGHTASYPLQNANSFTQVWDITDPQVPVVMKGSLSGSTYTFSQEASMLHEFAAMNSTNLYAPVSSVKIDNQNLHGSPQVQLIIVTYSGFLDAAKQLAAYHTSHDGLTSIVATTAQIYNEFSSGAQDISAIRDFAKMFYDRGDSATMPKYMLLFGGASFDYKNRIAANSNLVPVFETAESFNDLNSYCSDDFFGFLDNSEYIENTNIANALDIGVGRLPARNVADADSLVNKIVTYASPLTLGPWRIADMYVACRNDGAGAHMNDAEDMAKAVATTTDSLYNFTKVYEDAIPVISTPAGDRCPNANAVINQTVYNGAFMVNYNGHGNTQVWSGERILTEDDYNAWTNKYALPFMVTATCDFGQFDHPEAVSAAEQILLRHSAGSIAMLTTTQAVFAIYNHEINYQYLNAQYTPVSNGVWNAFGDAYRIGKNETYVKSPPDADELANFRKFTLMGDPALVPDFPKYKISVDSITDGVSLQSSDTISALGKYIINGSVRDFDGSVLTNFNGNIWLSFYDKAITVVPLDGGGEPFSVQNRIIYKGIATVNNGHYSMTFIAPKDINYSFGYGKISTYADNGITDAAGVDKGKAVGGFSKNPVLSNNPPIIKAYINDSFFVNGGIIGSNTSLFLDLYDETGINVSGNVIGHDLIAVLDGNAEAPYILNDYYQTMPNSYQRGFVTFPVYGLADGKHNFKVTAWDVNDNYGEGSVDFIVVDGKITDIQNLMNYPNPFNNSTNFVFEHNHPSEQADVEIDIFNTEGVRIKKINESITLPDSRTTTVTWDGTNENGARLPSGVYVYQLVLTTQAGIKSAAYQKLVIVR